MPSATEHSTLLDYAEQGSTPAAPASGYSRLYFKTSDHKLYYRGNTGGEKGPYLASGDTAGGDLTGTLPSPTIAKIGGIVYGVGSSFPGGPATGDRYYRTDRHREYFYDGTRWLGTAQHASGTNTYLDLNPMAPGTKFPAIWAVPASWAGLWIESIELGLYVATTNDATHYWEISVSMQGGSTVTGLLGTVNTKLLAPDTMNPLTIAGGGALTPNPLIASSYSVYFLTCQATGGPGNLYVAAAALVREVG